MRPATFVRTLSTWSPSGATGRASCKPVVTVLRQNYCQSARNFFARLLILLPGAALFFHPAAAQAAPPLETVLRNMDSVAASWKGMRAQVKWVRYDSLVDDRRVESGRIAVRTTNSGAAQMLIEFQEPSPQFISVRQNSVEVYKPRIKTVQEYDIREYRDRVENGMLLGFGTAGSYLTRYYEISLEGEETVAGQSTVKLDLQPRNPDGELNNSPVEMWISTTHWQPVQQKIYDRNTSDYRLSSYSEMETNPAFKSDEFKLPLARGTKRVRPQR